MVQDVEIGTVEAAGTACTYCQTEGRLVEAAVEVPIEPVDPNDPDGPRIAVFEVCGACVSAVLADEQTRDGDPYVILDPAAPMPEGVYTASSYR